ncbi:MAG: GNAT family protein [Saprospiraceae bacterium]
MQEYLFNIDTALITKRAVVRRFRENDGEQLYDLIQTNRSYLEDAFPLTVADTSSKEKAEWFVRVRIAKWLLQEEYCFGVWDNDSAKLIGFIRLFRIDWRIPKSEIGFFVDRDFSGKGIMTEVLLTIIRFAFGQLKLEKISLRTAMDNYASQRLARKCGFGREGDLRADFKKTSGEVIDVMMLGLTRGEWEKI